MSLFDTPINVIYLVETFVYFILLLIALTLLLKQFQNFKAIWITVVIFCVLKIVGCVINLYNAHLKYDHKSVSSGMVTAGLICLTIALAPLLSTARTIMERGTETMNTPEGPLIPPKIRRLSHVSLIVASALSIVGFTDQNKTGGSSTGRTLFKVGSLVYLGNYALLLALAVACFYNVGRRYNPHMVHYLYLFFAMIPFFISRILYSIISAFVATSDVTAHHTFSLFNGNWRIYIVMVVMTEMVISTSYCIAGYLSGRSLQKYKQEADLDLGQI